MPKARLLMPCMQVLLFLPLLEPAAAILLPVKAHSQRGQQVVNDDAKKIPRPVKRLVFLARTFMGKALDLTRKVMNRQRAVSSSASARSDASDKARFAGIQSRLEQSIAKTNILLKKVDPEVDMGAFLDQSNLQSGQPQQGTQDE